LPKLYNGKSKTFWFFAWEANKFGDPQTGSAVSTVPTAKVREGDLSEWRGLGANYQVYDPFSTVAVGQRPLPAVAGSGQHHPQEPAQPRRDEHHEGLAAA
jgi:hypothetical protein